ncbi:MAG: tetratricopeptide repeat protein [Solirubrobacterales bacterium]|nr:tetratricopeptide repeat protein [Solirubrobacterales bacterium]
MSSAQEGWEQRSAALWAKIDEHDEQGFIALIDALAEELGSDSAIARFERGAARDSTGHPEEAIALYRAALEAGLQGERRRRAVIQMASSLRNLGDAQQAVELLDAELHAAHDPLDGAVRAFLALADLGREREGLQLALSALSEYLPRYSRSLARYAEDLAAE